MGIEDTSRTLQFNIAGKNQDPMYNGRVKIEVGDDGVAIFLDGELDPWLILEVWDAKKMFKLISEFINEGKEPSITYQLRNEPSNIALF